MLGLLDADFAILILVIALEDFIDLLGKVL